MSFTEKINNYLTRNRDSSIDKAIEDIRKFCKERDIHIKELPIIETEWKSYKSDFRHGLNSKNLPTQLKNIKNKIIIICKRLEPYQENFTSFYHVNKPKPKIFVSFNNQDKQKVDLIESYIGTDFVDLIRFDKHFNGSKSIEDSINKSIKNSKATLLVVSYQSLSSAWVGTEAHLSLVTETLLDRKIFVCSIDNSIFEPQIIRKIIVELERQKNIFDEEIKERRLANSIDEEIETLDFDDDRHRVIIHKSSFLSTIDNLIKKPNYLLFGEVFKEEVKRLIKDIKEVI